MQAQATCLSINGQTRLGKGLAQNLRATRLKRRNRPMFGCFAIVRERKSHIRSRQGNAAHHVGAMRVFGLFGF